MLEWLSLVGKALGWLIGRYQVCHECRTLVHKREVFYSRDGSVLCVECWESKT